MIQDLRTAVRTMRRQPGGTLAVLLGLALGIGANVAIFSVADAVFLRPLPFPEGDRLVRLYKVRGGGPPYISLRPRAFLEVREGGTFFEAIVAQRYTALTRTTPDGPHRVVGLGVSRDWSETLGIEPGLGRWFSRGEERDGREAGVVVVSHAFWTGRLGADPQVLNRTLTLDGRPHRVIGVMPRGFSFPYGIEVWFPMNLRMSPEGRWGLNVQARLADGVDLRAARAELETLGRDLARRFPDTHEAMELTARPSREVILGEEVDLIVVLLATVGFLLLIVCANVGNLLLVRSLGRRRELAIRAALGAGRGRLVRQLLVESLLLAGTGGVGGLLLAGWSVDLLTVLIPRRLTRVVGEGVPLDGGVLAFALAATLLTAAAFGVPVALRASRGRARQLLHSGPGASGRGVSRLLDGVVVVQIALTLVLLAGAGLLAAELRALRALDLGYSPAGLVTFDVNLEGERYGEAARRAAFLRRAIEELEALPAVRSAGATTSFPLPEGGNFLSSVEIEGRPTPPGERRMLNHRLVSPGFLGAVGVPLLRGRPLRDADRAGTPPVAVISRSAALRYWPEGDALGGGLRIIDEDGDGRWITVVGVVGEVWQITEAVEGTWYVPYAQHADDGAASGITFAVRTATGNGAPEALAEGLRAAIWEVDPTLPVFDLATVEDRFREARVEERTSSVLAAAVSGFALLLAALGVYGLVGYAVGRRRREIGIRMALGEGAGEILRRILGRGLSTCLLGLGLGLAGVWALSRYLRGVLTRVDALDPLILGAGVLLLGTVAVLACYLPARRATRVDPVEVLQAE